MADTSEKLNTRSFRFPYALARITHGKTSRAMAVVYSYSNRRGMPDAECVLTRGGIAACAGVSPSTAARALKKMRGMDGFSRRDENGRRRYSLHIAAPGGCFRRYRYLFDHEFTIGGVTRRLTGVEEIIVSIIASHAANPNAKRGFEGSAGRFAQLTGYSVCACGTAIHALILAGIVHRPRRGTSRHRLSRYVICADLRRILCGEERAEKGADKPRRPLTKSEIDHDARTAYERHFSLLRNAAEQRADAARNVAEADPAYSRAHREIRGLEPKIAFAEVRGDAATVRELTARRRSLMVSQARALARLGLTAADLTPQYRCKKCGDTGYLPNGHMCNCWRPPKGGAE